jgi:methyl-accepting chemotaxis protein
VVAEEVRALARRSAEAARQTADLVQDGVRHARGGVELTAVIERRFGEIDRRMTEVAAVVGEIAAASAEQTAGVADVNTAVSDATANTERVAATAEESAATGLSLAAEADRLQATVGAFTLAGDAPRGRPPHGAAAPPAPAPLPGAEPAAAPSFRVERRRSVHLPN